MESFNGRQAVKWALQSYVLVKKITNFKCIFLFSLPFEVHRFLWCLFIVINSDLFSSYTGKVWKHLCLTLKISSGKVVRILTVFSLVLFAASTMPFYLCFCFILSSCLFEDYFCYLVFIVHLGVLFVLHLAFVIFFYLHHLNFPLLFVGFYHHIMLLK